MRQPDIWSSIEIIRWQNMQLSKGFGWVPSRPLASNCILPWYHRFKVAWLVLIGNYDAIKWVE